jgi:amidohydrolase
VPIDGAVLLDALLAALEPELAPAVALRERLHAQPELAHAEHRTAAAVLEALEASGAETVAGTGIVARLGPADVGAVAVRAELDALPVRERTNATFAATGATMHACGHDVHMAALVALFRAARSVERELPAPFVALFQPSEEAYPSGAVELIEAGALDGVETVAAAHVHPDVAWGEVAVDEGPVNASSDSFIIVIEGQSGHAAYPHDTRDPVVALAAVVVALQSLVSRRLDPLRSAVVTVGTLEAGSADNVIPEHARAGGTLRALHPDDRVALREALGTLAEHIALAHDCTARVEWTEGEPAIVNDAAAVARVRPLLERTGAAPAPTQRSCGSDDFGFFGASSRLLLLFVGVGGAPGMSQVPLHHPEFLPPSEAVAAVARAQAAAYVGAAIAAR